MKCVITGHRKFKLTNYSEEWIVDTINSIVQSEFEMGTLTYGYAGMASGVDLWFCSACKSVGVPYAAVIPFDGQENTMDEIDQLYRKDLISSAASVISSKNSWMVEHADFGIVVWDGNKGGTHNVLQQLVEKNKPFIWINPVGQKVWRCF